MANLLTGNNASFASGIGGWNKTTLPGNFTIAHSTLDGGVLKADVTTGGSTIAIASHASGASDRPTVVAGTTYTWGAKCKQTVGTARTWQIDANFWDASNVTIDTGGSSNWSVTSGTLTVGSQVTLSGTLAAPTGAVKARLRIRVVTPGAGETFLFDDAVLSDPGVTVSYGDTQNFVWTGSAWLLLREDVIT